MNRRRAVPLDSLLVLWRAVTLVAGEAILGIEPVELDHQLVAVSFGDNGGRGDGKADAVALANLALGDGEPGISLASSKR